MRLCFQLCSADYLSSWPCNAFPSRMRLFFDRVGIFLASLTSGFVRFKTSLSNKCMQADWPIVTPFEALVQKVQNGLGQKSFQAASILSRLLRRMSGWFQVEIASKAAPNCYADGQRLILNVRPMTVFRKVGLIMV